MRTYVYQGGIFTDVTAWKEVGVGGQADSIVGVVSQKQTWSGDTYTMSNIVKGDIPKLFIDIVTAKGAKFNEDTGYFELNGLIDISYDEMLTIFNATSVPAETINLKHSLSLRTTFTLCKRTMNSDGSTPLTLKYTTKMYYSLLELKNLEVVKFCNDKEYIVLDEFSNYIAYYGTPHLRCIIGGICIKNYKYKNSDLFFFANDRIEEIHFKWVSESISLKRLRRISLESILYMINNEYASSPITITLHAEAYTRAIADSGIQAALEAHPNISLASA